MPKHSLGSHHLERPRLADLRQRAGDAWGLPAASGGTRATYADWAALGSKSAEVRSLAGRKLLTPQPVIAQAGLRVWMY